MALLLKTPRFLPPGINFLVPQKSAVIAGEVKIGRVYFAFDGEAFKNGTEVIVELIKGRFVCQELQEFESAKFALREKAFSTSEQNTDTSEQVQAINLPFLWKPAVKVVLSGLSASSSGSGTRKSSVTHIQMGESLSIGRLVRKEGEMLCTRQPGKLWESREAAGIVTCPKCLEIAKRLAE